MRKIVGLFGTCAETTWRDDLAIPLLNEANVPFFNPVDKHWTSEARENEARHAASDKVILQIISSEDVSLSSLAESGWLALHCHLRGQKLVLCIQDMPEHSEPRYDETGGRLKPNKTRVLVRAHISKLPPTVLENTVFVEESIEEAVQRAIQLMQE